MKISVLPIVNDIEVFCKQENIDHRFVGGVSYGGLLTKGTKWKIDISKKIIQLTNYNTLALKRKDNTVRDIDIIIFCQDKKKITLLKQYISLLKKKTSQERVPFPLVSIEATLYPNLGKRSTLFQFVSALEVNKKKQLFLVFQTVRQFITWKSIEPWTVHLYNSISFTTRNPVADYYAYMFRSPAGIKPKDIKKIQRLQKLTSSVIIQGKKSQIDYLSDAYFGTWKTFIEQLEKSGDFTIRIKKYILKTYWESIGTKIAHGSGIWSILLSLSNQFTGIKQ